MPDRPDQPDHIRTVELKDLGGHERTPDVRLFANPRDLTDIEYHRIKAIATAADPGESYTDERTGKIKHRGKPTAKALMRLLDDERRALGQMRYDGAHYEEREAYLRNSSNQMGIKALYLKLGIAEMLTQGDWSVNREDEISEGFGVASLAQAEAILLRFHRRNGQLATTAPIREGKLVHLHAGCGTGVMLERLRRDRTDPFGNGRRLIDYFTEIGYADRIYYTLEDLMTTFLKDEYKKDGAVHELIHIICTLLLRRLHYSKEFNNDPSKLLQRLCLLQMDPNYIRSILLGLPGYLPNLIGLKKIKADGEFIRDTDMDISPECRALIQSLFAGEKKGAESSKSGAEFVKKYFTPEFWDPIKKPKEQPTDLAQHITIWPHHVILGKFEEFGQLVEEKPLLDMVNCFRASSHLEDAAYETLMESFCRRLKPGGIILDDGMRESYTRYERIEIWQRLQQKLGPQYRVEVICSAAGPRSILVQRCIAGEDGSFAFFNAAEKAELLRSGCSGVPIDEYATSWPERVLRSQIMGELRRILIDSTLITGDSEADRALKIRRGRFEFQGVHREVDDLLERSIFGTDQWRNASAGEVGAPLWEACRLNAVGLVNSEIKKVRNRVRAMEGGAILLNNDPEFSTETFPLRGKDGEGIHKKRRIPVNELPRNSRIPRLVDLQDEQRNLVATLEEICERTGGQPPLTLVEFGDCFTNPLMRGALEQLLGGEAAKRLMTVKNVRLRSGEYPSFPDTGVVILGGSLDDTYDPRGMAFTEECAVPLVKRIQNGNTLRAVGVCFGHQALLEAYGKVNGLPFKTVRGALEFGAFPVRFADSHASLKHLQGQTCTLAMTHSGYVLVPGYETVDDVKPLAFPCSGFSKPGKGAIDSSLPPVAFSFANGKIITSQFHPEVQLADRHHRLVLKRHLARHTDGIRREFAEIVTGTSLQAARLMAGKNPDPLGLSLKRRPREIVEPNEAQKPHHPRLRVRPAELNSTYYINNHTLNFGAVDKNGKRVPWIERDIGPAWFLATLQHHADSISRQLKTA
ncbi:hypothetical protein HYW83_06095 [Candidatus Peregrinibacteria bacterium]|nr:hypothetical protein [Candidatus Peregrinibacteria bacterium]